jgi:hypothetical protein
MCNSGGGGGGGSIHVLDFPAQLPHSRTALPDHSRIPSVRRRGRKGIRIERGGGNHSFRLASWFAEGGALATTDWLE